MDTDTHHNQSWCILYALEIMFIIGGHWFRQQYWHRWEYGYNHRYDHRQKQTNNITRKYREQQQWIEFRNHWERSSYKRKRVVWRGENKSKFGRKTSFKQTCHPQIFFEREEEEEEDFSFQGVQDQSASPRQCDKLRCLSKGADQPGRIYIFTLKFLLDWRFFAQVEGLVVNDNNYGNSKKYGNNDNIMQSFYEPPTLTTTTTRSTTLDAAAAFSLAAFHMNTSTFHRSTSTLQMTTSTQSTVSSDKQSIPPTRLTTEQSWKSHSYPPE